MHLQIWAPQALPQHSSPQLNRRYTKACRPKAYASRPLRKLSTLNYQRLRQLHSMLSLLLFRLRVQRPRRMLHPWRKGLPHLQTLQQTSYLSLQLRIPVSIRRRSLRLWRIAHGRLSQPDMQSQRQNQRQGGRRLRRLTWCLTGRWAVDESDDVAGGDQKRVPSQQQHQPRPSSPTMLNRMRSSLPQNHHHST